MSRRSSGSEARTPAVMRAGRAGRPVLAPRNLVLFGPSGAGKTSVGAALAELLGRQFVDLDQWIVERAGKSIPRIFAEQGEAAFRRLEGQLCRELAQEAGLVIACGGGTLVDPANRRLMEESGIVVLLECAFETLLRRLRASHRRPLLADGGRESLRALLEARRHVYHSFPLRVDTTSLTPRQAARQVAALVSERGGTVLPVRQGDGEYPVLLGPGLLARAGEILTDAGLQPPFVVVSDSNVGPLYGAPLAQALSAALITLPAGEEQKTLATVGRLYERFVELGLERSGTVVALGGGVVGDLAGFAAASYMRGVAWVNVPTSLLAMVDASVGGKVGVNLAQGKNLVGAFYPPALVLADISTLETLPAAEFATGMAELVKAALVGDPELFAWLEGGQGRPCQRWLERALAVKVAVVEADPLERGPRAKLNLGHTVAHGLEKASAYQLRHGQAVAVGMIAEARMAEAVGLAQPGLACRLEALLPRLGLPTRCPGLSPAAVWQAMAADKKRANGRLRFSLPARLGRVEIGCALAEDVVLRSLAHVLEAP